MRISILTTDNREPHKDYANPLPHFGTAPEALLQGFTYFPEAEIHVVACLQKRPVTLPEKIAPNIFYHGLIVPKWGWLKTGYQGCIRAVRKKLREIQPDIVHGQGTERDCGISAVLSGFPNVLTIHGNMRLIAQVNQARPFSFQWLAAQLEKVTLPRTAGVVAITHYTQNAVEKLTPRTWVLPNAVDQSFFDISATPDPAAVPIGLCVGTICHRKNQNAFIQALDSLAQTTSFKIIFLGQVGNDPYGTHFRELLKTRPWCEHAGFANRETLKKYFRKASFLALPTLEDNCPMVVLEAMAAGVPVMASNVGGVPDLIQPEVTGLFGNPQQPESFAANTHRLLLDKNLAARLAVAAKAHARARFHPQVIAGRHLAIYHDVLSDNRNKRSPR